MFHIVYDPLPPTSVSVINLVWNLSNNTYVMKQYMTRT